MESRLYNLSCPTKLDVSALSLASKDEPDSLLTNLLLWVYVALYMTPYRYTENTTALALEVMIMLIGNRQNCFFFQFATASVVKMLCTRSTGCGSLLENSYIVVHEHFLNVWINCVLNRLCSHCNPLCQRRNLLGLARKSPVPPPLVREREIVLRVEQV